MGVIGLLGSVTARQWAPFTAAFLQGLSETGIVARRLAGAADHSPRADHNLQSARRSDSAFRSLLGRPDEVIE
jgi:hypothetical protein